MRAGVLRLCSVGPLGGGDEEVRRGVETAVPLESLAQVGLGDQGEAGLELDLHNV